MEFNSLIIDTREIELFFKNEYGGTTVFLKSGNILEISANDSRFDLYSLILHAYKEKKILTIGNPGHLTLKKRQ